jgi:hypothetical protein
VVLAEMEVMRRRLLAVLAQQTSMRRRVCVASPFLGFVRRSGGTQTFERNRWRMSI